MTVIPTDLKAAQKPSGREPGKARVLLGYLVHDKLALISAIYLLILIFAAIFGPMLVGDMATKLGLRQRNMAPFSLEQGWLYVLGADTLGRSILARLVVRNVWISPRTPLRAWLGMPSLVSGSVFPPVMPSTLRAVECG